MKKLFFTFCFTLVSLFVFAQNNYEKNIEEKAKQIYTAKTVTDYDKLFKEFSTLKKSQDPYKWKAYYYAGFIMYKKAELILNNNLNTDIKNTNALAEKFISGALSTNPNDKESTDLLNLIQEQRKAIEMNIAIK